MRRSLKPNKMAIHMEEHKFTRVWKKLPAGDYLFSILTRWVTRQYKKAIRSSISHKEQHFKMQSSFVEDDWVLSIFCRCAIASMAYSRCGRNMTQYSGANADLASCENREQSPAVSAASLQCSLRYPNRWTATLPFVYTACSWLVENTWVYTLRNAYLPFVKAILVASWMF